MNKNIKTIGTVILILALFSTIFVGCGKNKNTGESTGRISLVSREDGSGTKGAFVEIFGIEEKDVNGNKVDNTADTAEVTNSTSVMMTTIAGNKYAIGYISLGSLNDSVKALKIDSSYPTAENIKNGKYKISRQLNIVTKNDINDKSKDFINYMLSDDGQKVVEKSGYIGSTGTGAFVGTNPTGKITVAGSSSVTPVMEKLKEAYNELNPNLEIEIQQNDSSTGINSVTQGICDIGMSSRELDELEMSNGLKSTVIARDGIAVIVNKSNPVDDISSEEIKAIYTGELTNWNEIGK